MIFPKGSHQFFIALTINMAMPLIPSQSKEDKSQHRLGRLLIK